jgi:hypothetical protein
VGEPTVQLRLRPIPPPLPERSDGKGERYEKKQSNEKGTKRRETTYIQRSKAYFTHLYR